MKKLLTDVFYNALYQVFLIVIPIITLPYLSRVLGAGKLGVYAYVNSTVQFIIVFCAAAMGQIGARNIARVIHDQAETDRVFWGLYWVQLIMGMATTLIYVAFFLVFRIDHWILFLLQLPTLIGTTLDISWFFIGIQDFRRIVIRNTLIKLATVVLILTLVRSQADLPIYILINSVGLLVGNLVFWVAIRRYLSSVKFVFFQLKATCYSMVIIMIPQLASQIYTSLDRTILKYLSNEMQVSYYDNAQKIARIVLAVVTSLTIVMMPRMASSSSEQQKTYLKKSADVTLFFSFLLMSVIICNTDQFVPWFFDPEFSPMAPLMKWACLIIVIIPFGNVFASQFALAKRLDKEYAIPVVIGAVISVSLNFLLIPRFGAAGATMTLLAVETAVCILRLVLVRKEYEPRYVLRDVPKYIVIGGLSLLVGTFLPNLLASPFFNMALKSICIGSFYLLCFFIGPFDLKQDILKLGKRIRTRF